MGFGIYIASIFTVGNLGMGFYSIISSAQGNYSTAAWLIMAAMVFDGLDGTIARVTKTTSYLGIELDSFADITSFCIAPAVLMYFLVLKDYKLPGLAVAFLFVVFGALRLARYNIKSFEAKSLVTYFEGLPSPAAGGILASIVLIFGVFQKFEQGVTTKTIPLVTDRVPYIFQFMPLIMLVLGFLMITKLRYISFSKSKIFKKISLRTFILIVVGALLILSYPENMIFIIFSIYVLSGVIEFLWRINKMQHEKRREKLNGDQ
ncbi:MAG: CDP-diacylglycerol--serine O-phosphatidyltransferase [Elusimicrobia bacterium]|nr:CDP-diacylglycerol--serine O-phosphatidyltransferase [Elusimicrobiota bacterium]MBU2614729.1 CDP-diacylglycerol--serine O-phosphatidyltransferase [Elusimicrobiota bacterium]